MAVVNVVSRTVLHHFGCEVAALIVWLASKPHIAINSALSTAECKVVELAIDTHMQLLALSPKHNCASILTRALEWIDV